MRATTTSKTATRPRFGPGSPCCHISLDAKLANKIRPRSMVSRQSRSRAYRENTNGYSRPWASAGESQNSPDFENSMDCMDTVDQGPIYKGFLRSTQMRQHGLPGPRRR
jgi:hypothetical protein